MCCFVVTGTDSEIVTTVCVCSNSRNSSPYIVAAVPVGGSGSGSGSVTPVLIVSGYSERKINRIDFSPSMVVTLLYIEAV